MKMSDKIRKAKEYMQYKMETEGRDWFSPTEIGHHVLGGHSSVGSPICLKMVELNFADRNDKGHYRLSIRKDFE